MKRKLLVATISYIIGIIIGVYLSKSIPFFIVLGILFIVYFIIRNKEYKSFFIINILIFLIASIYVSKKNFEYENKYLELNNTNIQIIGTVVDNANKKENYSTFTIKVNENKKYNGDYLIVNYKGNLDIKYGNKVLIIGIYEEPNESRNYQGFNYKNYLKTKKVYGIISTKNIRIIKKRNVNIIDFYINRIKEKISNNLNKILPLEKALLAYSILLGKTNDLSEEIQQSFKNSNLSHMLAISGTHVSYIMVAIFIIFNKKIIGIKKQKIIIIIFMIFFIKLTGATPSILRAGIVCIIYMLAGLFYREQDIITSLSIATIITLIDNPFNLFSVSMQLSYAGSLSIIIFNKIFMEKEDNIKNKILKYIKASALVSISANIFIIPIMAYNFNTISLTFVFSNLVASPVLCTTIIIGLITIIFSFFSINITYLLGNILNLLLLILIKISNFFSKISLSSITVVTPSIVNIIMYYIICSLVIYFHYTKKKISKKAIVIITIVIIITEMAIIVPIDNCLKIHFIDVNQGDSTLIITNCNKKILIDSGGMTASSKFDIGENVLLPYLLDRRIKKLDYVIISHFDSDHCQALETLIGKIKISKLIISKQPTISKEYKEIMNLAINNNIQIVVVKRGDKIQIDKCTYLEILHPSDKFLDDGKGGLNANAIVCKIYFKVDNKYITALFTGDIEKEAEIELEKIYGNKLSADILKVAHHGSKTSSDEKFLKYVNPKIALIGVGEDNNFGHPNGEVLERFKNIGAHIYRTDEMGEISIKIDKEGKIKVKKHINNE